MTNPKDFKTFLSLLPGDRKEKMWYIPLNSVKKPDTREAWKENYNVRLSSAEAYLRLKNGKNVGIVALQENLMFLDLDVSKGKFNASPLILDAIELIPTMTVRTRNGGIHKYFINEGKYVNQLIYEGDTIIGELRTNWQYVVSVGSYSAPDENNLNGDGWYRLISGNTPISQFQGFSDDLGIRSLKLLSDEVVKSSRVRTKKEIDLCADRGLTLTEDEHSLLTAGRKRVMMV